METIRTKCRFLLAGAALCLTLFAGTAQADLRAGAAAYTGGDYAAALSELRPLATQGDVVAQFIVGMMYNEGEGLAQDYSEAARWYSLAAAKGYAPAQNNLGSLYRDGHGMPQNYSEAGAWLYRSAADSYGVAGYNLADMYLKGQGVAQDTHDGDDVVTSPQRIKAMRAPSTTSASSMRRAWGCPKTGCWVRALPCRFRQPRFAREQDCRYLAELAASMSKKEIEAAEHLAGELAQPGGLLKELKRDNTSSAAKDSPANSSLPGRPIAQGVKPAGAEYPARPAKRRGVVTCNTRCVNATCWRTYDDGRQLQFTAKRAYDALSGEWKFESGSC